VARTSATFARLIDLKDQAHYGVLIIPVQQARSAVKWARLLVDRARDRARARSEFAATE
jgi:hypothetical protein